MKNRHDRAYARNSSIDFKGIAAAALASAKSLLHEWLLGGRFEGREYADIHRFTETVFGCWAQSELQCLVAELCAEGLCCGSRSQGGALAED